MDDMNQEQPAIMLTFPELRSDILELMRTTFASHTESFVTKDELEILRARRDEQANEGNLRLDKMDIRLDGLEKRVERLFHALDDIKKQLTNASEQDRSYRQKQSAAWRKLDDNHQEYRRKNDEALAEVKERILVADNRSSKSLEVATTASEKAEKGLDNVKELHGMIETKIDPISGFIFGDDSHPPLMKYLTLQQSQLQSEYASSHNKLQDAINENRAEVESLKKDVKKTVATVDRFNVWADRVIGFSKSKVGATLITYVIATYLNNSPLGDLIGAFLKYLMAAQ